MSQATKSKLRTDLEAIQRDLAGLKNKQMMALVDDAIKVTKAEVELMAKAGKKVAVLKMNIGSDAKAIKRAIDEIKKVTADFSFLGVAPEADKITVFAVVTDDAQKAGLKANDWVSASVASFGGRGGGKPGMAQGSTAEASKLGSVVEAAERFIATR